jgi:hypothetical protein
LVTPYPPKPDALALAALVVESLDELTRKPNPGDDFPVGEGSVGNAQTLLSARSASIRLLLGPGGC